MLLHLFKMIWNKKKENAGMIVEMFVSFLVLFAVFSMVVNFYQHYRAPRGFNKENVWVVSYAIPNYLQRQDSVVLFADQLRQTLRSMPEIADLTITGQNVPYSANINNTTLALGGGAGVQANSFVADAAYKDVLELELAGGRWFTGADRGGNYTPIVINQKMAEALGNTPVLGRVLKERDYKTELFKDRYRVVGIVNSMKEKSDYSAIEPAIYQLIDSGSYRWNSTLLVKVKPGADAAFESKLFKTMSNLTGSSIEIEHLEKKRIQKNKLTLTPMIIMLIVGGFLIINVALGLFGVLWYNINKRRGEIGLRRAIGASGSAVSSQLVGEALTLSTLALLVGLFFAVQFPLLRVFDLPVSVYLAAIVLAVVCIYLLVFICALYPGRQAAAIYPAVALHEE